MSGPLGLGSKSLTCLRLSTVWFYKYSRPPHPVGPRSGHLSVDQSGHDRRGPRSGHIASSAPGKLGVAGLWVAVVRGRSVGIAKSGVLAWEWGRHPDPALTGVIHLPRFRPVSRHRA